MAASTSVRTPAPADVVTRFRAALAKGDRDGARALLADDLHFKGPFDEFHRADDYLAAIMKLAQIVKGTENVMSFVAGDEVAVFYDMVTNTPAGTAAIAERYRVSGGKVVALRAIFDARPFAPLFAARG